MDQTLKALCQKAIADRIATRGRPWVETQLEIWTLPTMYCDAAFARVIDLGWVRRPRVPKVHDEPARELFKLAVDARLKDRSRSEMADLAREFGIEVSTLEHYAQPRGLSREAYPSEEVWIRMHAKWPEIPPFDFNRKTRPPGKLGGNSAPRCVQAKQNIRAAQPLISQRRAERAAARTDRALREAL